LDVAFDLVGLGNWIGRPAGDVSQYRESQAEDEESKAPQPARADQSVHHAPPRMLPTRRPIIARVICGAPSSKYVSLAISNHLQMRVAHPRSADSPLLRPRAA